MRPGCGRRPVASGSPATSGWGGFVPWREHTGALLDVLRGEGDAGEAAFRRLLLRQQRAGRAGYWPGSALGIIGGLRGRRPDERRAVNDSPSAVGNRYKDRRPWAALAAGHAGRIDEVAPALVRWLEDDVELLSSFRQAESVAMVAAVPGRTRDFDLCRQLDELIVPYAGQWLAYTGMPWGAVNHYRALLARGAGDTSCAEALPRDVTAGYDAVEERPWRAHAAVELTEVLARRAGPDAADEAITLAEDAAVAAGDGPRWSSPARCARQATGERRAMRALSVTRTVTGSVGASASAARTSVSKAARRSPSRLSLCDSE